MEELEAIVQRMIDAGEPESNIKAVIQEWEKRQNAKKEKLGKEIAVEDAAPAAAEETKAVDTDSVSAVGFLDYYEDKDEDTDEFDLASQLGLEKEPKKPKITLDENAVADFNNNIKASILELNDIAAKRDSVGNLIKQDDNLLKVQPELKQNKEAVELYNKNVFNWNQFNDEIQNKISSEFEDQDINSYIENKHNELRSLTPLKNLTFTPKEEFDKINKELEQLEKSKEQVPPSAQKLDPMMRGSYVKSPELYSIEQKIKDTKKSLLEKQTTNSDILAFNSGSRYYINNEEVSRSAAFDYITSNEITDDPSKANLKILNDESLTAVFEGNKKVAEEGWIAPTARKVMAGFYENAFKPLATLSAQIIVDGLELAGSEDDFIRSQFTDDAKVIFDEAKKEADKTGQDAGDLFLLKYDTKLKEIAEDIRGAQIVKTQDAVDRLKDLDFVGFAKDATELALESSSYLVMGLTPVVGTSLIANSVYSNNYYDLVRNGVPKDKARVASGINSVVAIADNLILKNLFKSTLSSVKNTTETAGKANLLFTKEQYKSLGNKALNSFTKEFPTEFTQGTTETVVNMWAEGKPIDIEFALRNGVIEASASLPTSTLFATVPGAQYLAMKYKDFKTVRSVQGDIEKLFGTDLGNISTKERKKQIKVLADEYINAFENSNLTVNKATISEQVQIRDLTAREALYDELIEYGHLSDEQKNNLQNKLAFITANKDLLIDKIQSRPISDLKGNSVSPEAVVVYDGKLPDELENADYQTKKLVTNEKGEQVERTVFLGKDLIKAGFAKDSKAKQKIQELIDKKSELIKEIVSIKGSLTGPRPNLLKENSKRLDEAEKELEKIKTEINKNYKSENIENIKKIRDEFIPDQEILELQGNQEIVEYIEKAIDRKLNKEEIKNIENSLGFFTKELQTTEGRKDIIFINKDAVAKLAEYQTANHEFLHALLKNTANNNPDLIIEMRDKLDAFLKENIGEVITEREYNRLKKLLDQPTYKAKSPEEQAEEFLTFFSELVGNGKIKYNESFFAKLEEILRRVFQNYIKKDIGFENGGRDVYNFIKDYNTSIKKGKLTKAQKRFFKGKKAEKKQDIKDKKAEADVSIMPKIKDIEDEIGDTEGATPKQKEYSDAVQKIYDKQGLGGAFEIFEYFKPITSRIADKYRNVPGFDKQLLIDEFETGENGMYDLISTYDPSKGVPLAAYINKLLPLRVVDIARNVLKEEFESDISEQRGVAAEETDISAMREEEAEVDLRKIKIADKLFDNVEILNKARALVEERLKNIPKSQINFKMLGNMVVELLEEVTGVPAAKISDTTKNLSTPQLKSGLTWLMKNADVIFATLPKGYVEGETQSDFLYGTSTGIRRSLLQKFYNKLPERVSTGPGLQPYELKSNLTKQQFLAGFGIENNKIKPTVSTRQSEAAALKAIIDLAGRLITNQLVRESDTLTASEKQDVASGKSDIMFSKKQEEEIEANIKEEIKEAAKDNNSKLPKDEQLKGDFTNDQVFIKAKKALEEEQEEKIKEAEKKNLSKQFNEMLEQTKGVDANLVIGEVRATKMAKKAKKFKFFVPPGAEDFLGLMYSFIGKGKQGDAHLKWIYDNLINPYIDAMNDIDAARVSLASNFRQLKKGLGVSPKKLKEFIPTYDKEGNITGTSVFTVEDAIRYHIWKIIDKDMDIPGLEPVDERELALFMNKNRTLQNFARRVIKLTKGDKYPMPKKSWAKGTISTDLLTSLNEGGRAKYLKVWQKNVDEIFSYQNQNKIKSIYGESFLAALRDSLRRQKTGLNTPPSRKDKDVSNLVNWMNGEISTIMFFNTRSAALQLISFTNFINLTDNNPIAAARAYADPKQFVKDFIGLWNSPYLVTRRDGLTLDVNIEDIATLAEKSGIQAAIAKLAEQGFLFTKYADSTAIALGGATFYRNRINTYLKQGMSPGEAENKAFNDFRLRSETVQQSSNAMFVSKQQAGGLGRIILAFANTPMQYTREIKKAASDLRNRRGDAKTNISKIIYYGVVQNLIFNFIQQAIFAVAFDDDGDEDLLEEKSINILNSSFDTILRGSGIHGALIAVIKNAIIRGIKESKKDRPKYEKIVDELIKISPPISSKYSKLNRAADIFKYKGDEIYLRGLSPRNPALEASFNVISATTNLPLDRLMKKAQNISDAFQPDINAWQRLFLMSGWPEWQLGIEEKEPKSFLYVEGEDGIRVIQKNIEDVEYEDVDVEYE